MIGYVVVSDRNLELASNIRACTRRRDNLNVALIAFNLLVWTSTRL